MLNDSSGRQATVWYPDDLDPAGADGDLYGYFQIDTHHYVVLSQAAQQPDCRCLSSEAGIPALKASHGEKGWSFTAGGGTLQLEALWAGERSVLPQRRLNRDRADAELRRDYLWLWFSGKPGGA